MEKITSLGLAFASMAAFLPTAFAAESAATMNQPNNGFYEGANPEWATSHSTDSRGTSEHRQYHRDAVRAHLDWHEQNKTEQGATIFYNAHRLYHQEMNMAHRRFHTAPVDPNNSNPNPADNISNDSDKTSDIVVNRDHTYTGSRPTRRSVREDFKLQNALRRAQ